MTNKQLAEILKLPDLNRLVAFSIYCDGGPDKDVVVNCSYATDTITVDESGHVQFSEKRYSIRAEEIE